MRLLLTLALFLCASVASATTWTCVRDFDSVGPPGAGYMATGNCTASGNYVTGGDALGATATAADTAAALCGSSARTLVRLALTAQSVASTTMAALSWSAAAFKLQLFTSNGAGPAFLAESTAQALPTGLSVNFVAFCR